MWTSFIPVQVTLPSINMCLPKTQRGQHREIKAVFLSRNNVKAAFSRNNGKPETGLLDLEEEITELHGSVLILFALCTTGVF